MQSKVNTPPEIAEQVRKIAQKKPPYNDRRPQRFLRLLRENHATVDEVDPQSGLWRKSPLIVAFGDSVTAGWFEGNTGFDQQTKDLLFRNVPPVEHVTDIQHVYHEQFRLMLGERYERTSVSVVNSGISGDTATGMLRRIERDVLRYHPDLVLLNASLNWHDSVPAFQRDYRRLTERLVTETEADVIVITPNLMVDEVLGTLEERVAVQYETAEALGLCVCDTYTVWKQAKEQGIDIRSLLSNGVNHPTVFGHWLYANELMKLFV